MKNRKFLILALFFCLFTYGSVAQNDTIKNKSREFNLGVGIGVPYGVMGIGWDFPVVPNLNLHGAVGTVLLRAVAYNVGIDVYFRDHNKTWRPKATILYGINSMIEEPNNGYGSPPITTYSGISVGIGQNVMFGRNKKHGFNFSVFYIANKDFYNEVERLKRDSSRGDMEFYDGRFKIAIGYQYKLTFNR